MSDLIRRSAVIDAIRGEREYLIARKQLNAEHILAHHFDAIMDDIPAVDAVEVRHGEWAQARNDYNGTLKTDEWYGPIFVCSVCGEEMLGTPNFCPNCGAKMEVEE